MRCILEKAKVAVKRNCEEHSGESSGRRDEICRESFHLLREYIDNHEQNVDRNTDVKGHSSEVLDENEEHVIQNQR